MSNIFEKALKTHSLSKRSVWAYLHIYIAFVSNLCIEIVLDGQIMLEIRNSMNRFVSPRRRLHLQSSPTISSLFITIWVLLNDSKNKHFPLEIFTVHICRITFLNECDDDEKKCTLFNYTQKKKWKYILHFHLSSSLLLLMLMSPHSGVTHH